MHVRTCHHHPNFPTLTDRYRSEVVSERRHNVEMSVALRAVQRASSQPTSPMHRAIQGGTMPRTPSWGPGHTAGSVQAASGQHALRPSTAAPRVGAGTGPGSDLFGSLGGSFGRGGLRPTTAGPQMTRSFSERSGGSAQGVRA